MVAARDHAQPRARADAGRLPRRRPAQARPAHRRRARARQHRGRPAAHPRRGRARRSDHRDPLGAGLDARADRARVPRAGDPRAHAADGVRAARRRAAPSPARCARCASRTCSAASRCTWSSSGSAPTWPGRPCSSPAPAARSAPSCAARSPAWSRTGSCCVDHAEDNLFAIQRELEDERHVPPSMLAAVLADCKEEERMREVFAEHRPTVVFHAAAYKHVGLMEANPVEAVRNNAIATRVRRARRRRARRRALRARLDRQGGRPGDRHGRLQGARRVRARGRHGALPEHPLRGRALRQRARLLRQRGADLPPPDRARRPGHGHRRAHDPLLHDDPRGGPADHPLGLAGRARAAHRRARTARGSRRPRRRGVRAGHGRAGADRRPRPRDDRALRPRPRPRHRHRDRRRAARARSSTRSSSTATSARGPTAAEKILLAEREPLAAEAVESMFDEIGLLVLEGDAAGLAAKVSELSAERCASLPRTAASATRGRPRRHRGDRARSRARRCQRAAPAPLVHSPNS